MNCSQYFLQKKIDMVTWLPYRDYILGTTLIYKRNPYVHSKGSLVKAETDNSSPKPQGFRVEGSSAKPQTQASNPSTRVDYLNKANNDSSSYLHYNS